MAKDVLGRITKRTPLVPTPACDLRVGQYIVTRSGEAHEVTRKTRNRDRVMLYLGAACVAVPAAAPVMAYAVLGVRRSR